MALIKNYNYQLKYTNSRIANDVNFKEQFTEAKEEHTETLIIQTAYFNISKIEGDKNKLYFVLCIYKDSTKQFLVDFKRYDFTPDTSSEQTLNFYTQAYNYLKKLTSVA